MTSSMFFRAQVCKRVQLMDLLVAIEDKTYTLSSLTVDANPPEGHEQEQLLSSEDAVELYRDSQMPTTKGVAHAWPQSKCCSQRTTDS